MSKRKKRQSPPLDKEVSIMGPLKATRIGRNVQLETHWPPGAFEELQKHLKAQRPEQEKQINEIINRIVEIVNSFDPLRLLSWISIKNNFGDPETYKESDNVIKEYLTEYVLSLSLANKTPRFDQFPLDETFNELDSLLTKLYDKIRSYLIEESAGEKDANLEKQKIRFFAILRYLMMRGDSFPEHHIDLLRELYSPHDAFLKEQFGFTTQDLINFLQEIERQLNSNVNKYRLELKKSFQAAHQTHKNIEQAMLAGLNLKSKTDVDSLAFSTAFQKVKKIPQKLEIKEEVFKQIALQFSAHFGENESFLAFPKSAGWPTNDSIITDKPLIEHSGQFYCFAAQFLERNVDKILARLIRKKNLDYFKKQFKESCSVFLEKKALEFFKKLLPDAETRGRLFYHWKDKRPETDGLVLWDGNLFILEGKAGEYHVPARRGGLTGIQTDFTELVKDAYTQAKRTKDFILADGIAKFEDEKGNIVFEINPSKLRNIFLVNVTLENLGPLAIQLNSMQTVGFFEKDDSFWSVFINDLRVISEIIEFPSEFIDYSKKRQLFNTVPQYQVVDELDLLMLFLKRELVTDPKKFKDFTHVTPDGSTEDLDRYYNYLAGLTTSGEKPKLNLSKGFQEFIRKIEESKLEGLSEIAMLLLNAGRTKQDEIIQCLKAAPHRLKKPGQTVEQVILMKNENSHIALFLHPENSPLKDNINSIRKRFEELTKRGGKWNCIIGFPQDGLMKVEYIIVSGF